MKTSTICEKVVDEIKQIPEERQQQILDVIHQFRIGLQVSKKKTHKIGNYAGCWKDMPEDMYRDFLNEVNQRRHTAFSGRRDHETKVG